MCGHLFIKLSRYNKMFSDNNIKSILEEIFNELNIVKAESINKNDLYNYVELITSNKYVDSKFYFNADRIYIYYHSLNNLIEYELTSSADLHKREYILTDESYIAKETYRKYDYLKLSDNVKTQTQLRINTYVINKKDDLSFFSINDFKSRFDNYIKYNPSNSIDHMLEFNAKLSFDLEELYSFLNFKYDDFYINTKNKETNLYTLYELYTKDFDDIKYKKKNKI